MHKIRILVHSIIKSFFSVCFSSIYGLFLVSLWCMSKDVSSLQVVISLLFFNPDALIEVTEGMVGATHCSLRRND